MASTFFLFYFATIIVLGHRIGKNTKDKRDEHMVNKIIKETEKNEYEDIFIICGKDHKDRITEKLEERKPEWKIDSKGNKTN